MQAAFQSNLDMKKGQIEGLEEEYQKLRADHELKEAQLSNLKDQRDFYQS